MSRSNRNLKKTKKRKVNKTLKKNVRKSMNRKVVKRYNKKTIKKQSGGVWSWKRRPEAEEERQKEVVAELKRTAANQERVREAERRRAAEIAEGNRLIEKGDYLSEIRNHGEAYYSYKNAFKKYKKAFEKYKMKNAKEKMLDARVRYLIMKGDREESNEEAVVKYNKAVKICEKLDKDKDKDKYGHLCEMVENKVAVAKAAVAAEAEEKATAEQEAAAMARGSFPLRLVYTHSGRIMCILYSLLSGRSDNIDHLNQLVINSGSSEKQGKFYNNCVIELLFYRVGVSGNYFELGVKIIVSGNIPNDDDGEKRLCSQVDKGNPGCQVFNIADKIEVDRENIPHVILRMLKNTSTRVMLIRHGEAEHNLSANEAAKRKQEYNDRTVDTVSPLIQNAEAAAEAGAKVEGGGFAGKVAKGILGTGLGTTVATGVGKAAAVGAKAVGLGATGATGVGVGVGATVGVLGLGKLAYNKAMTSDRGYMQDSDITLTGISEVELSADKFYNYLKDIYIDKNELCNNLLTYVSMLKRTFHTAALFNGVLAHNYGIDLKDQEIRYEGLSKFEIDADLGEISSTQVKNATFTPKKEKRKIPEYNESECAPFGNGKSGLKIEPHIYTNRVKAAYKGANNTPCSKYKDVNKVTLQKYEGEYDRNNKCDNKPLDKDKEGHIFQYTTRQGLDGFEFTLTKTVNQVYEALTTHSNPIAPTDVEAVENKVAELEKGGSKRKLKKSNKRKTKNIRK